MELTEGDSSPTRVFPGHGTPRRNSSSCTVSGVEALVCAGPRSGSDPAICNFATPDGLIEGDGVTGPVSYSAPPCFPGIFAAVASADSGVIVTENCGPGAIFPMKTVEWEGGEDGRGKRSLWVMAGAANARPAILGCRASAAAAWIVFSALTLFSLVDSRSVLAQSNLLTFQGQLRPPPPGKDSLLTKPAPNAQMLVQANEIRYDYNNQQVSAVGNVQIYYNGATIEADKVIYDQRSKRLHAEGNARLTEADGKISYGQLLDLSDDYRDGFIDSLRLETPDQTRMAAARADRTDANYTVFQSGVYTACEPCRDDPRKPPLWQVKAARIIHNESEKMMYFEDARIEFFGVPLAWVPYFSAPDPTVKRKTGFLMPIVSTSSAYGFGIETPYYIALAPNYDATISPRMTSTQGPLLSGEWRQRFEDGDLTIHGAGIDQLDKNKFIRSDGTVTPGFRDWRGSVESSGRFELSPQWTWGFDAVGLSDRTFFQDYKIRPLQTTSIIDPLLNLPTEGVSQ